MGGGASANQTVAALPADMQKPDGRGCKSYNRAELVYLVLKVLMGLGTTSFTPVAPVDSTV